MTSALLLMQRMRQRDTNALAELYDRFSTRVHTLCHAILRDDRAAEEATQDVFMKLWNRPDSYQNDDARFEPWLMKVARNAAIDTLRKEKRLAGFTDPLDDDTRRLADLSQIDESRWREMANVLETLTEQQRAVIELAYYYGLSQSEIAEHLSMPLGTVKTKIRLGMERLRDVLFERPDSGSGRA